MIYQKRSFLLFFCTLLWVVLNAQARGITGWKPRGVPSGNKTPHLPCQGILPTIIIHHELLWEVIQPHLISLRCETGLYS